MNARAALAPIALAALLAALGTRGLGPFAPVSPALAQATAQPAPTPSGSPAAQATLPPGAALIVNTGSTNIGGYTIVVMPDGSAQIGNGTALHARLESAQTASFFGLLAADAPLPQMHTKRCMKSASFGSSTYVEYEGSRTPDISCGGDATVTALGDAVNAIVQQLGVTPARTPRVVNPRTM